MRLTNVGAAPSRIRRCPRPGARIQSGPSHAAKGGAPPPPTIMAITSALPRLLKAAAAPAMTWLPLNVVIVDNDRAGDSPSSYRARALRANAQEVSRDTAWTHARWQPLPGTRLLSQSARGGMTRC
jgi:hypothetical protein